LETLRRGEVLYVRGRHLIHTNAGRAGGRPQYHCVCSERRRHGSGACRPDRFHEA